MKYFIAAFSLLISSLCFAGTYIDSQQLKSDNAKSAASSLADEKCVWKTFKTRGAYDDCRKSYLNKASELNPARGTDAYGEKYYARMSRAQAIQQLTQLQKIYNTSSNLIAQKSGEISQHDAEVEGWWIQIHVLKATATDGLPWFVECKKQLWKATVDHCPLGSGGV